MPLAGVDHDALTECLAIMESDPAFVRQQQDRPWRERAETACYRVQSLALHLRVWECTPVWWTTTTPTTAAETRCNYCDGCWRLA
jgi:hypothetical protein